VVGYVRGAHPAPLATIDTFVHGGDGKCSLADPWHDCLAAPRQVAVDPAGDVYIADGDLGLREVTTDGVEHTVVPGSTQTCASTGDGGPASAGCVYAIGIMRTPAGDLYISDSLNARLRKVSADGIISTVAGNGMHQFCGEGGLATQACLAPFATAADASGRLYIADPFNNVVRRINLDGTITTVAGQIPVPGVLSFCPHPYEGLPATQVCMHPIDLALDAGGNLYLAEDSLGIRKVDAGGLIRTVVGGGNAFCGDGGPASAACVRNARGVAFDQATGSLLVSADGRVRRIDSAGTITTIAGHGPTAFCGEGGPAPAGCLAPWGLAVDAAGRTYVADPLLRRVWLVAPPA